MPALDELTDAFDRLWPSRDFQDEFQGLLRDYVGRPTPTTHLKRVSEELGFDVYAKREDLAHTGAHKINNALGQAILARRMGKKRIIAETGAGQHGVATATACALFGLPCVVYMGEEDMARQALNVFRMRLMGAEVRPISSGTRTLKDATNEAMRDWVTNVRDTHYILGSCVGPHPYPKIVRELQKVIGIEAREQMVSHYGGLPSSAVACVGGGSNAIGFFYGFLDDPVELIGVEAAGDGLSTPRHAAPLNAGRPGVLHGCASYLMQDDDGQVLPTHSVSAGLDYPGVGPEHSYLKDSGRAQYVAATDEEALSAFRWLAEMEGIVPAFESAHAFAHVRTMSAGPVLVNLSGRGDKDMESAKKIFGL